MKYNIFLSSLSLSLYKGTRCCMLPLCTFEMVIFAIYFNCRRIFPIAVEAQGLQHSQTNIVVDVDMSVKIEIVGVSSFVLRVVGAGSVMCEFENILLKQRKKFMMFKTLELFLAAHCFTVIRQNWRFFFFHLVFFFIGLGLMLYYV